MWYIILWVYPFRLLSPLKMPFPKTLPIINLLCCHEHHLSIHRVPCRPLSIHDRLVRNILMTCRDPVRLVQAPHRHQTEQEREPFVHHAYPSPSRIKHDHHIPPPTYFYWDVVNTLSSESGSIHWRIISTCIGSGEVSVTPIHFNPLIFDFYCS